MENILFYTPDIKSLMQNVYMGPQAQVLELIDDFNDKYIKNSNQRRGYSNDLRSDAKPLGITKKFYWKPGAYDTIKRVIWYQSEMHKKAASLEKVLTRAKDNTSWRFRNLIREINDIETILTNFRREGLEQQDNTDNVIESWEFIKNRMIEQYENSNDSFNIYMSPIINEHDELQDYHIHVMYNYEDITLKYKHAESPHHTIAEIKMLGKGYLTVKIPLSRLINKVLSCNFDLDKITNFEYRRYGSRKWNYNIGGKYLSFDGIEHPYISNRYANNRSNGYSSDYSYVCVGNLETEIKECIKSLDFLSLKIFFDRVMTHYDTNTGPLNRITSTYHGQPKFLEGNEEYYSIQPIVDSRNCTYPLDDYDDPDWVEERSFCAEYCTLKSNCDKYLRNSKKLSQEEIQQRALEYATLQLARGRQR